MWSYFILLLKLLFSTLGGSCSSIHILFSLHDRARCNKWQPPLSTRCKALVHSHLRPQASASLCSLTHPHTLSIWATLLLSTSLQPLLSLLHSSTNQAHRSVSKFIPQDAINETFCHQKSNRYWCKCSSSYYFLSCSASFDAYLLFSILKLSREITL